MKFQLLLLGDDPGELAILKRCVTGQLGTSQREHLREFVREVGLTGQLSIEVILAGEVPKKESNGIDLGLSCCCGIFMALLVIWFLMGLLLLDLEGAAVTEMKDRILRGEALMDSFEGLEGSGLSADVFDEV